MSGADSQAALTVMCSNAFVHALRPALPALEARMGGPIALIAGSSVDLAANSIPARLRRGERADVVLLFQDAVERLVAEELVEAASLVRVALSGIGVAVRRGAPVPEIGSAGQLRNLLSRAGRFAYSASASGAHVSTTLLDLLELPAEVRSRGVCVRGEPVGDVVARGDADLGFQQISELLPVAGVTVVGPLPAGLQKTSVILGAVAAGTTDPSRSAAFLHHLRSPDSVRFLVQAGLDPCS